MFKNMFIKEIFKGKSLRFVKKKLINKFNQGKWTAKTWMSEITPTYFLTKGNKI